LTLLSALLAPGAAAEDGNIDARRHDLEQVEQRVESLEQDLEARRSSREVLLAELEQRERDIANLALAGRQLTDMIQAQQRTLKELEGRLEGERNALASERAGLAGLLRSAYALGRGDRIRLLLDQEDLAKLSRVLSYYGYLNRYRLERLEAAAARARRLEALTRETADETARLAQLAARQEETRNRLAQARAQRALLLENLEQTIASGEDRVSALRAEAEGLRSLIEQLERQASALPEQEVRQAPIGEQRGRLGWPMPPNRLIAVFGTAKADTGQAWDGVLIAAPEGTEVRAVHPGRVVYADWLRGFGLLTIIEHDEGYMTLYGHNQTLLKEPGEWVAAGDSIALSGASGGLSDAGLYFAIRHRGRPLDPQQWCLAQAPNEGADKKRYRLSPPRAERPGQSAIELVDSGERVAGRTGFFDLR